MTKEAKPRFWDRSEGNLNGFILYSGLVIKHMEIPDYEGCPHNTKNIRL